MKVDEDAWTQRVAQASGLYKKDPQPRAGEGNVRVFDGAVSRPGDHHLAGHERRNHRRKTAQEYQEVFAVGTQAQDGMRLDRSYASREAR